MRKIVGCVEPREVLVHAPGGKIVTENAREVGRVAEKYRAGRKPTSSHAGERLPATSRIPVTRAVWGELAGLKRPGETFDHLLSDMIEREKENRFFEDMDRIEKRGKFVAMEW
jgi:hypothetical protein